MYENKEWIEQLPESEKILCLSIDGGGVRGIIVAQILREIEKTLGESLYNIFDAVAGTSTGAIIAALIAANKNSAEEILQISRDTTPKIFQQSKLKNYFNNYLNNFFNKALSPSSIVLPKPTYLGDGKRRVYQEIFKDIKFRELKKPLLVTAYDYIAKKAVIFKSTGGTEAHMEPYLYEVIDASTAAPTYFPPVQIGDKWMIDGGVATHNPSLCQLSHAFSFGYRIKQIYMISIGTGRRTDALMRKDSLVSRSKHWNGLGWVANGLIDDFQDGGSTTTSHITSDLLRNRFCRLNFPLTTASDRLDDCNPQNLAELCLIGKQVFMERRDDIMDIITRAKE